MGRKFDEFYRDKLNYNNLYKAYLFAKRGKCYRDDVIKFSLKYECYLNEMLNDLKNNCYRFGKYNVFYVYEPKKRKVLAASFRDRILHSFLINEFLYDIFVPTFIDTSYACLKGRGMHKCMIDVRKALSICNRDLSYENGYILKMDIAKFFFNIDRDILFNIIKRKIYDKEFLDIIKCVLDSSSYLDDKKGISIPIGNFTSQMFANIYLNEIDQFIKHKLRVKFYFRYMDDSICFCKSKEEAIYFLNCISDFLNVNLHLKLNSKTSIFKISNGVNFCGYKIKYNNVRIRERGKKKLVKKLKYIDYSLINNLISIKRAKELLRGHLGYINFANVGYFINNYFYS